MNTYVQKPYSSLLPFTFGAMPAAVVTALLIVLMHSLIDTEMPKIIDDPTIIAPIVRPPEELPTITKVPPAPKPTEVTPPPARVDPTNKISPQDDVIAWSMEVPAPDDGGEIKIVDGGGGIVAYLKTQAIYPSRALSRGIEGHVDLAFDITSAGSTTNIRVIDAQPKGTFERASISALKKWKYKVPVIDGAAQEQVDMMTRMTFELEK